MLSIRSACKRFGDVVALDEVSLDVARGRVTGFLGPNGAGKTTAMRAALALTDLDSGEVRFDDSPLTLAHRRRFGYMPEERGLYPRMRVGDHLRFLSDLALPPPGVSRTEIAARTGGLLERVGLSGHLDSRVEQLSFGNRQRVQLVAALAHSPEVLILDEPFSGLDPAAASDLVSLIRSEAAHGTAVLFSSHQMDMVADVCDDVALISAGRIRRTSTLADWVASSPVRRLSATFSGPAVGLSLPEGFQRLPSSPNVVLADAPASHSPSEVAAAVSAAAADMGLDLVSFSFTPPPLSELFAELLTDPDSSESAAADSDPEEQP